MAIQTNFPAIKPSLLLDFANVKQLDPRITFTRASEARYYDGKTVAKAEENLLLRSQEFDIGWSTADNVSISANTTAAPDGTTTADTLAETAVTGIHTASQSVSASGVLTLSVFAKANSGTPFLTIGLSRSGTDHCSATFDLALGTNTASQAQGVYSGASATITSVAQGFYRCTLTVTTDTASTVRIGLNNTGTPTSANRSFGATYLGSTSNSIYIWGAQLEQRSSVTAYTTTTTQPITNYIPVLLTAPAGVARFDHNPTTGESLGLLIEEQRTNLLTYSEQFDNAAWTKTGATVAADAGVSPDGTQDADKLVEGASTGSKFINAAATIVSGTTYTASFYAKASERTQIRVSLSSTASWTGGVQPVATFSLTTGAVVSQSGSVSATSAVAVGNGWYRFSITSTAIASTSSSGVALWLVNEGSVNYTGDGYSGVYIWGAQLEAGAFPTSYIPTVAAQVTRSADAASMTGTNFSSWYRADEGTLYIESALAGGSTNRNAVSISDGTNNNEITLRWASGSQAQFLVDVGAVAQASIAPAGYSTIGTFYRRAAAYRVNDFEQAISGTSVGTDTIGTIPVVSQMQFASPNATVDLCGYIRKFAYYPIRLSSANLQALTS